MSIEFSETDLRVLKDLDFTGVIRCDARPSHVACRDAASHSFQCRNCSEKQVLCETHTRQLISIVNYGAQFARCPKCNATARLVGVLFAVEAIV